ncbi:CHAD domain-containing protein [Cognatilysobacter bugurensis]|uniref:CHAD domain-containing protein n=1 Tax=Cognatilysobacter bugurensis TaxID=543356 RepID=A0A918SYC5_9GAMM|nr:CHAD domain-containing protein [Lysobacter bugurensis]GHA74420.1 CHAD domain-containing protein [Lysobacter bugurensis]
MSYRIRRKESIEIALRRIALEQIDAMLKSADSDGAPGDVAHAIRKRCKKLRALLRLVRGSLDGYGREQRAARDVARRLAPVRDAAVRLDTLDRLTDGHDGLNQSDAETLRNWLDASRTNALHALAHEEVRAEVRIALREQRERVASWTLDDTSFSAIRDGLSRTYRRGRDGARACASTPTPDGLHELRKRVKYHRFQLDLLRGLWRGPLSAASDEAGALAEVLGDHHDAAVLVDALRAHIDDDAIRDAAARAIPLLEARMRELERRALAPAARLFAEKPKAFERRMRAYWRAWRLDELV